MMEGFLGGIGQNMLINTVLFKPAKDKNLRSPSRRNTGGMPRN
jgi:hypothetical protein